MRMVLDRAPSEIERAASSPVLRRLPRLSLPPPGRIVSNYGVLAAYVRTLFGSNEFLFLD